MYNTNALQAGTTKLKAVSSNNVVELQCSTVSTNKVGPIPTVQFNYCAVRHTTSEVSNVSPTAMQAGTTASQVNTTTVCANV